MTSDRVNGFMVEAETLAAAHFSKNGHGRHYPDAYPEDQRGDAWEGDPPQQEPPEPAITLPIVTCAELLQTYPERRPAVIEGLLRRGETMNVISSPKIGKSWLALGLAFSIATGRLWLGTFACTNARVLLIDNELHSETCAHRLRTLALADGVLIDDIADRVHVLNLRGRLQNLIGLGEGLLQIEHGRYDVVILDAFYRALPIGTDENDNGAIAGLYNQIDRYADSLGAAFVLIHHSSKGNQGAKAVTDVGSGAGSQSRAADTHLILRAHEETNAVVLDAAVRSWPPLTATCLRWDFPLWRAAPDLDPTELRIETPRRRRRPESQDEPGKPVDPPWTAERLAKAFIKSEPRPRAAVLEDAHMVGLSDRKANDLLKAAIDLGHAFAWKEGGAASRTMVSTNPTQPIPAISPEATQETEPQDPPKVQKSRRRKVRK